MAFQQGLSGLSAAGKALDVTGNNIANASTVGFKASRTDFADVYGASMATGGASQVGIGVSIAGIQQQFTQGNTTTTSNTLDLAINGAGFFKVSQVDPNTGNRTSSNYTRNGQYHLDKDGYIINDQGFSLIGIPALTNGTIPDMSDSLENVLNVYNNVGSPVATSSAAIKANLNGDATIPTSATFDPTDVNSYNNMRSMDVYDSEGGPHTLSYYFRKTGTNSWDVYTQITNATGATPAKFPTAGPYTASASLTFNTNGVLSSTAPPAATTLPVSVNYTAANLGGGVANLSVAVDFTGITQFKSAFSVDSMTQDGFGKGKLAGLTISTDGTIQARYDTGKTSNIGRVALYNFSNPNGLQSLGNNLWSESYASGQPTSNYPGSGNTGTIQSSALEESNVDLTVEMVNLIVQQRNYQANAQTIKTQDQVMQTLVNIR